MKRTTSALSKYDVCAWKAERYSFATSNSVSCSIQSTRSPSHNAQAEPSSMLACCDVGELALEGVFPMPMAVPAAAMVSPISPTLCNIVGACNRVQKRVCATSPSWAAARTPAHHLCTATAARCTPSTCRQDAKSEAHDAPVIAQARVSSTHLPS